MGTEIETTKKISENVFSRELNPVLLVTGQMPLGQWTNPAIPQSLPYKGPSNSA